MSKSKAPESAAAPVQAQGPASAAPAAPADASFDMMAKVKFGDEVKRALDAWIGTDCPVARVVAISLAPEGSGFDAGAIITGGLLDDVAKHMAEIASRAPTAPIHMESLAQDGELAIMLRFPFPESGLPPYLSAREA